MGEKLTRSKIAYDLKISPHKHQINYGDKNVVYVFSSELYRNKFIEKYEGHRNKINESLSNRFGFTIKSDVISDMKLYTTIEKRGFLIYCDGVACEWLKDIILDGNLQIMKN